MAEGYIKLHRKITDNWIWQEKPFSKGQAWVDLLLLANHSENKFLLGNEVIVVEVGQVITSEVKLMERWGWSKSKVRAFLDLLQKDKMIVKKTDRKKTTITLCNYSDYHTLRTTEEPQKDREKTAKEPQKDTIKNDKNDKNEKNDKKDKPLTPFDQAIEDFKDFRKQIKKPMTDRAVELLLGNLQKLAGDNDEMKIAIINQSILNGWIGVFALKPDQQPQTPTPTAPKKPQRGHLETKINEYGRAEQVWVVDKEI